MSQLEQPDNMDIATTRFSCGRCGGMSVNLLDSVFVETQECELSWLACPNCGWDDRPDRYEPGAFYEHRYAAE